MTNTPARQFQGAVPASSALVGKDIFNMPARKAEPAPQPAQQRQQMRRYVVSALMPDGNIAETRHTGPATPLFENAFCAFSRGSLVETEMGPVAIEDLLPGDRIVTADGEALPLLWKGSVTVMPGLQRPTRRSLSLTRFMADSFGMARPMSCVVTGPAARLLLSPQEMRGRVSGPMLTPVRAFLDGENVVETTPPSPVDLFHLCLSRHAAIRIGGLAFETYHPGPEALHGVSEAMRGIFLNLFPHVGSLSQFGSLAYPRADEKPRREAVY
jgi:hypothetical protein